MTFETIATYIFYFTIALVAFILIAYVALFILTLLRTLRSKILRRTLSIGAYRCFYVDDGQMIADKQGLRLYRLMRRAYDDKDVLGQQYKSLSRQSMPINVMANWIRSIAEDIYCATVPQTHIEQWSIYFKSNSYYKGSLLHPDFAEFHVHELAFLWGGVAFWLIECLHMDADNPILQSIEHEGCTKMMGEPYYHFLSDAAMMDSAGIRALPPCGSSIAVADLLAGFEHLSVKERREARRVLNDLLPDNEPWHRLLGQMKQKGWFREKTNITINHIDQMIIDNKGKVNHY